MSYGRNEGDRVSLTLVTAPPAEPLRVAEARLHCRIDASEEDSLVTSLIEAARQHLDGPDGILGRALIEQQWDLKIDEFPGAGVAIVLPLPPLRSVDQISYLDTDGVSQVLASSVYQTIGDGASGRARIVEAYNQNWPSTRDVAEAVTVRFTCGYAPSADSPPDYRVNVPWPIKQAMLLTIADWYENRGEIVIGASVAALPLPVGVLGLLTPYRLEWF